MRRHGLIAYDICDDLRLRRVHAIVRDFAQPMQYSVFLAQLSDVQKAELVRRLGHAIHHQHDQVLLFDLGPVHGRHDIELPKIQSVGRELDLDTDRAVII